MSQNPDAFQNEKDITFQKKLPGVLSSFFLYSLPLNSNLFWDLEGHQGEQNLSKTFLASPWSTTMGLKRKYFLREPNFRLCGVSAGV